MPLRMLGSRSPKYQARVALLEAETAAIGGAENAAAIVSAAAIAQEAKVRAEASMPDLSPITIQADHTGEALADELPADFTAKRFQAGVDVTESSVWSMELVTGAGTGSIGAADGEGSIDTVDMIDNVWNVSSTRDGNTITRKLVVTKHLSDPPPSSGTGVSSAYDGSIASTSSSAYGAANAGPMTLTCGASGEVQLSAPLTFKPAIGTPVGSYPAAGIWQYRPSGGGAWTDAGVETASSYPGEVADEGGRTIRGPGSITINKTVTGLTPSSDYDFQLLLRVLEPGYTMNFTGTASAVTS